MYNFSSKKKDDHSVILFLLPNLNLNNYFCRDGKPIFELSPVSINYETNICKNNISFRGAAPSINEFLKIN